MNAAFRGKGVSPTNHSWYQSSRVIALSCGIKISAVRHLVLSQSTRVTDRRTDRITTPKTALAYARAVKINTQAVASSRSESLLHFRNNALTIITVTEPLEAANYDYCWLRTIGEITIGFGSLSPHSSLRFTSKHAVIRGGQKCTKMCRF